MNRAEELRRTILVVDDESRVRKSIAEYLSEEGYRVLEAEDTQAADRSLSREGSAIDLILLDVNLPDMDGYSVCRAIRHVDKKVPIVFVTAKGDLKDYTAGRDAGGDSYLVKPIARAALRSIVNLFTSIERAEADEAGQKAPSS